MWKSAPVPPFWTGMAQTWQLLHKHSVQEHKKYIKYNFEKSKHLSSWKWCTYLNQSNRKHQFWRLILLEKKKLISKTSANLYMKNEETVILYLQEECQNSSLPPQHTQLWGCLCSSMGSTGTEEQKEGMGCIDKAGIMLAVTYYMGMKSKSLTKCKACWMKTPHFVGCFIVVWWYNITYEFFVCRSLFESRF